MRHFNEMLRARWAEGKCVCIGLDSDLDKIPEVVRNNISINTLSGIIVKFNRRIVDATHDLALAYKPNIAFYEAYGDQGWIALRETIRYIHEIAPSVPVILDAKRADIGNTNAGYVLMAFGNLKADAITVHPYLGREALMPFLNRKEKGIFVLCRTSNPGSGEFQDLHLAVERGKSLPFYQWLAHSVGKTWNKNGNCGLVVGATYPEELESVRILAGDLPILIPGIGAQGGDVEKTVKAGVDGNGSGMIINSSRGIIFASSGSDYAERAREATLELHNEIHWHLTQRVA